MSSTFSNLITKYYNPIVDLVNANNEGLNIQKKSGNVKFGRVTVHYEILDPEDLSDFEKESIKKYNIKKPTKLTYEIDGEPIPDSLTDPKFDEMFKILKPIFDDYIDPYFEKRGYNLWTY